MANYHLSMKPLSRSSGRSAVAAAAYRAGVRLELKSTGEFHDFTAKRGIVSADIILPEGMKADWVLDRSRLWNAAENAEVRKDARVAREFEVALPHELDKGQRHALVMEFSQMLADRYGVAVDAAIHKPDPSSDQRNHHVHILMTTRKVGSWGLGDKSDLERENAWLIAHGKATSHAQLLYIRKDWEDVANVALQRAGHNVRIDHRSYEDRGIDLVPSTHVGVFGTRLGRRGASVERVRLSKEDTHRNADLVRRKPSWILDVITSEKSVFTERDVSRALWRCAVSKADMQELLPLVMASPKVCVVQGTLADSTYDRTSIKYSTQKMVALETRMVDGATAMAGRTSYGVASKHVTRAIKHGSQALRLEGGNSEAGNSEAGLSEEQIMAIRHVTNPEHISVVIGYAGSGKSTMLLAAREAWESQGYRVHGASLAGKAAKGLEDASAIASRTLASWQRSWDDGYSVLRTGDVLVLDEAGMVGSVQMARLVDAVERAGAKLVLVGDSEQLQAIGAGSAFKAIQDIVGAVGLEDVRRQRSEWQRDASIAFASHRTQAALALYDEAGVIHLVSGGEEGLRDSLLAAYVAQRATAPSCDVLVLAHRRRDVAALNEAIRAISQASGWIAQENDPSQICDVSTTNGDRQFVKGDRLVFLENDREMGVKNGTLGTVLHVGARALQVRPDGEAITVDIPLDRYDAFDHGYATTIHKAQGATAKHSFVLVSETMDRHLTYVAMTRHRESVALFADEEVFGAKAALSDCLSRSGLKETTLDYIPRYARPEAVKLHGADDTFRDALMKVDPKQQAMLEFAQASVERLRQKIADLPVLAAQDQRLDEAAQKLDRVWPGQASLLTSAITEQPADLAQMVDLKGRALLKHFERMSRRQAVREGDPEYRASRFLNKWVSLMSNYQDLDRPTKEQTEALQGNVQTLSRALDKDPVAQSMIKAGQVKIEGQAQKLSVQRLDVADLLKGRVPSWSLGRSLGGPSFGY